MAPNVSIFDPATGEYASEAFTNIGKSLYLNEELADFHFICKSSDDDQMRERIPAHKFLLISGSDVFRAMFNESWIEKTEVEIKDASADAFKEFLQFFYSGKIKLTMENAAEVMNLGNKYDVAECFDICAKFLRNNLNDENVFSIHELAVHLKHNKLDKFCEIFMGWNAKAVLASEGFLECDRKMVKRILQMDTLNCSEAEAFEALMNWIKAKTKQNDLTNEIVQGHFRDLVCEIRLGLMTIQEFAKIGSSYRNLFSSDEYSEIIQIFASAEYQPTLFTEKNRKERGKALCTGDNEIIKYRRILSKKVSITPYYMKNVELTKFSVTEYLWLDAVHHDNIFEFRSKAYRRFDKNLPSEMTITETADPEHPDGSVVLHRQKVDISCTDPTNVLLTKSILIRPGFMYEIQMEQTPPENCCTGGLLKSVLEIEPGITVRFHNDPTVDGDFTARGTIAGLSFRKI